MFRSLLFALLSLLSATSVTAAEIRHEVDLLVVGGNEAGVAAAVQAARLGVKRIALVNDIAWLGGQFSAEAVGAVDEWTIYRGKRVNFPRSGMFLEVMESIRRHNGTKYGLARPGNAVTASDTIEPAAAAHIFAQLVDPYADNGSRQIMLLYPWRPIKVATRNKRVEAVTFESPDKPDARLTIRAALTIDCSDWGDVIRLSGAAYRAGPDLKADFGEPSAPEGPLGAERNEMNPISYCAVLRESAQPALIPKPDDYDERKYHATSSATAAQFAASMWPKGVLRMPQPPFIDSAYPEGMYSTETTVYTQRRLVDRHHNGLPPGTETILFNWPVQDYPLYRFPQRVVDALEATEPGAAHKNVVDMSHAQRAIVFADAKRQTLGMLHHLQTLEGLAGERFRALQLVDDFGTHDRLPPKPYIREGLRLVALSMLREQDIRTPSDQPRWAKVMVPDALFGFQFNIDFHPTRRQFLNDDPRGPWGLIHTANRNWSTHTDRAMFSVRGLVSVEIDGLLGGGKNIGLTSIASAALRLHGQMMLCGQAAGTVAWMSLRDGRSPRQLAADWAAIRALQQTLIRGVRGAPGVLIWPYHDLPPDDLAFVAAQSLAVRGIHTGDATSVDFDAWKEVSADELGVTLRRARALVQLDAAAIEYPAGTQTVTWGELAHVLRRVGFEASRGLDAQAKKPLVRSELVRHVWHALERAVAEHGERHSDTTGYLTPRHDADGDGLLDLVDPLPFDRDNDNLSDSLDPLE